MPRSPETPISIKRANVVVFIPPPVLHGDAPTNIIMHVKVLPVDDSRVWSTEEKPAVELAIIDWNMLLRSFLPPLIPENARELNSDARKKNVPNTIIAAVIISTILVWS